MTVDEWLNESETQRKRTCQSRSKYGNCGLETGHPADHAVPIGDAVWFVYPRGRHSDEPLGYAKLEDEGWQPL